MKMTSRAFACMILIAVLLLACGPMALAEMKYGISTDGYCCLQQYDANNGAKITLSGSKIAIVGHQNATMNFAESSPTSLTIPATVSVGGSTYSVEAVGRIGYTSAYGGYGSKRLGYLDCLKTVTFAKGPKAVGADAFSYCTSLQSVTLSSGVTTIYNTAFSGCTGLTYLYIPTSVTTIGDWALNKCDNVVIHYQGTSAQWAKISYGSNNTYKDIVFEGDKVKDDGIERVFYTKYAGDYVVKGTSGYLAINNGPGTSSSGYKQIGRIPEGTKINITKATGYNGYQKSSGNWGYVTYGGVTGYCAMNYLAPADSMEASSGSSTPSGCSCSTSYAGYYVVRGTAGSLAINSGHGSSSSGYKQLGTIPEGATVYISKASGYSGRGKSSGQWGHVTYNGVTGYCAMNYLDVTDSTDSCSTSYAGYYKVKNTSGALAINNGHGHGGSYKQLGTIPEGTQVYISKAMNYKGLAKSSGYWGHVTYNGVSGYCSMNYLEFVSKDVTRPTVSNLHYENLSVSGFDVVGTVSDNVGVTKVQCAVWTLANGNDDLDSNWWTLASCGAVLEGNTARYRVAFSEHNNEKGSYRIEMYAYDAAGNSTAYSDSCVLVVNVDDAAPEITGAQALNLRPDGYDVIVTAADAGTGVTELRVISWTDAEGRDAAKIDSRMFSATSNAAQQFHIDADRGTDVYYHTVVTAVDMLGNTSVETALDDVYIDTVAPSAPTVSIVGTDPEGLDVEVSAADEHALSAVRIMVWTPDNGGDNGKDMVLTYEADADNSGTYLFRVSIADHDGETYTRYSVAAQAEDACGNVSAESDTATVFVDPELAKFILPGGLNELEEDSLSGIAAQFVIAPEGLRSIGSRAFADNDALQLVLIPSSVTKIADDALSGCANASILAPSGSYAQEWAEEMGVTWIRWDGIK